MTVDQKVHPSVQLCMLWVRWMSREVRCVNVFGMHGAAPAALNYSSHEVILRPLRRRTDRTWWEQIVLKKSIRCSNEVSWDDVGSGSRYCSAVCTLVRQSLVQSSASARRCRKRRSSAQGSSQARGGAKSSNAFQWVLLPTAAPLFCPSLSPRCSLVQDTFKSESYVVTQRIRTENPIPRTVLG